MQQRRRPYSSSVSSSSSRRSSIRSHDRPTRFRDRQRTFQNWEVAPRGYGHIKPLAYKSIQTNGNIAPNALMQIPMVGYATTLAARRLYVGNIPFGVTEDEMMEFFNLQMHLTGLAQAEGNPVLKCQVNLHRNFAFLEFRSTDETTNALSLNYIKFMGATLRVRRPYNYKPLPGIKAPLLNDGIAKMVPDSPNKIFVAGFPKCYQAEQVIMHLNTMGKLKSFHMMMNVTGYNKGYAFCEYVDPNVTEQAIYYLTGMQLGKKRLLLQPAHLREKYDQSNMVNNISESPPTTVLCLLNMITLDELRDDAKFVNILGDTLTECSKHAKVLKLEFPRPIEGIVVPGCGKGFVQFESAADCQKVRRALQGRKYNDRYVVTLYFDPAKYFRREF